MHKRLENSNQRVFVLAKKLIREFCGLAEGAFDTLRTHGIDHVVREAEGNEFWFFKRETFVEETVKVYVEGAAIALFQEYVFAVSVS
jgi:hypothetical protein